MAKAKNLLTVVSEKKTNVKFNTNPCSASRVVEYGQTDTHGIIRQNLQLLFASILRRHLQSDLSIMNVQKSSKIMQ
jgi:hypothetical protein